jgi:hypothetical protein
MGEIDITDDQNTSLRDDDDNKSCIIYKFQSRPPFEGFILILIIIMISILFIWWLNKK